MKIAHQLTSVNRKDYLTVTKENRVRRFFGLFEGSDIDSRCVRFLYRSFDCWANFKYSKFRCCQQLTSRLLRSSVKSILSESENLLSENKKWLSRRVWHFLWSSRSPVLYSVPTSLTGQWLERWTLDSRATNPAKRLDSSFERWWMGTKFTRRLGAFPYCHRAYDGRQPPMSEVDRSHPEK